MENEDPAPLLVAPRLDAVTQRYLALLRRCLTRELFIDEEVEDVLGWPPGGVLGDSREMWKVLGRAGMRIVRPVRDLKLRDRGAAWPPHADTMIGPARLHNVQELVIRALEEDVPGDLVETGVWRGGVIILMRAILAAYGDEERRIWACDSFEGLPDADVDRYPADSEFVEPASSEGDLNRQVLEGLAVPLERVKANVARYDLLDDRVIFLKGWFRDTLPSAPIDHISVLRVDGDLYESTVDTLTHLEPKVSAGGFVIIDDYNGVNACREAVDNYRAEQAIMDEIHEIDWTGVWWQRSPR